MEFLIRNWCDCLRSKPHRDVFLDIASPKEKQHKANACCEKPHYDINILACLHHFKLITFTVNYIQLTSFGRKCVEFAKIHHDIFAFKN